MVARITGGAGMGASGSKTCDGVGTTISVDGLVSHTGWCTFGDVLDDMVMSMRDVRLTESNLSSCAIPSASSSSDRLATIVKGSQKVVVCVDGAEERGEVSMGEGASGRDGGNVGNPTRCVKFVGVERSGSGTGSKEYSGKGMGPKCGGESGRIGSMVVAGSTCTGAPDPDA